MPIGIAAWSLINEEGNPLHAPTVADLLLAAGRVNKNATHAFGGVAKEVRAVLPGLVRGSNQPQPDFVDECGGLQCVAGRFAGPAARGEVPQLVIDERQQLLSSIGVPLLNAVEDAGDVAHRWNGKWALPSVQDQTNGDNATHAEQLKPDCNTVGAFGSPGIPVDTARVSPVIGHAVDSAPLNGPIHEQHIAAGRTHVL